MGSRGPAASIGGAELPRAVSCLFAAWHLPSLAPQSHHLQGDEAHHFHSMITITTHLDSLQLQSRSFTSAPVFAVTAQVTAVISTPSADSLSLPPFRPCLLSSAPLQPPLTQLPTHRICRPHASAAQQDLQISHRILHFPSHSRTHLPQDHGHVWCNPHEHENEAVRRE